MEFTKKDNKLITSEKLEKLGYEWVSSREDYLYGNGRYYTMQKEFSNGVILITKQFEEFDVSVVFRSDELSMLDPVVSKVAHLKALEEMFLT